MRIIALAAVLALLSGCGASPWSVDPDRPPLYDYEPPENDRSPTPTRPSRV